MTLFEELLLATGIAVGDLSRLINTAPARYKTYLIPKKTGGQRLIAHPSRELKLLQRVVLDAYLHRFPVHPSATAYQRGSSIFHNAVVHSRNRAMMKFDFESFFPSLKPRDWSRRLGRSSHLDLPSDFSSITVPLLFWGEKSRTPISLSIGAPTSPIVSNIIMFDIDDAISREAEKVGVTYTRYADDITLSGESTSKLERFEKVLIGIIRKSSSPKLVFNEKKRGVYHKGNRRTVTGLTITPDEKVSIGRDRKRMISAMIHHYEVGQLVPDQVSKLKGWIAFAIANEPTFVTSMRRKYGPLLIDGILAWRDERDI